METELTYDQMYHGLIAKAITLDMNVGHYGEVIYDRKYKFLELDNNFSKNFVVISAGFHGNERAGPLTILHGLEEILDHAKWRGMELLIYPVVNPSGFEKNTRFNIANEEPNNDFLRYKVGYEWIKDLKDTNTYDAWKWSTDVMKIVPHEAKLLQEHFKTLNMKKIKGFVDLHQDEFGIHRYKGTYAYIYDDSEIYKPIVDNVEKIMPVVKNIPIGAGFNSDVQADKHGFLYRHDGSIHDLFFREGVPYSVTVETTTNTDMNDAIKVNLAWIKGIIDLASGTVIRRKNL